MLPAPRPKGRRWPLAVLGALLVGAVGVGGLAAYRALTEQPYPDAWDPRVGELVSFVERERGLAFKHPVHVDFLADDDFRSEATEHEDLTAAQEAEMERYEGMLRAVGILAGDVDLETIEEELIGDGVVGQYSLDDQRISVRGTTLDDERRSTLVHELTHALQDQHFKIGEYRARNSGGEAAFLAVVEADADHVAHAWEATLSEDAREALATAQAAGAAKADFAGVPEVFIELKGFPYVFGPGLLDAVIADKGHAGRNSLFTHPPLSEEHIILPATYLDAQPVTEVRTPALANGEKLLEGSEDDFGMASLLVVLAERLDYDVAWKAVQGWSGDASVAFERDGRTCVRMDVLFDEAAQAERFDAAVGLWSKDFPATHSRNDRTVRVDSCDPGTAGPAGRPEGHVSGLQGLSIRADFMFGLASGGLAADKTGCVADGTIELVTTDRLAELDRQFSDGLDEKAVAEVQRATAKAAKACGA